jgi:hypothetical protein
MELDYKQLANVLLDCMCETIGLVEVVEILIGQDFSNDDILSIGFEQETIDQAQDRINKGLGE